ncbi:MAG: InlB B-repeat-containing protein [Synergistes sp.]|nr:InlB B-repeat-containing protein [Synergistes sp.]
MNSICDSGVGYDYSSFNVLDKAFTTTEKVQLAEKSIVNDEDTSEYKHDKLFLLSVSEYNQYKSVIGTAVDKTPYALSQGLGTAGFWWTRTKADADKMKLFYVNNGQTGTGNTDFSICTSTATGVRPAIIIKDLSSPYVHPHTEQGSAQIRLSYNANGGSGAPAAQTSSDGKFTVSSVKPTRSGKLFLGWAASSSATSAQYSAGQQITLSKDTTLYAVWADLFTLSFNANGGTGAPSPITAAEDGTVTIPSTVPTRNQKDFKGWALSSTAATADYVRGQKITLTKNTTLYAVWADPALRCEQIEINGYRGGASFTKAKPYFKNGDNNDSGMTGTASDYNAWLDYSNGVLYLKNYRGATICVLDGEGQKLTIRVVEDSIIYGDKYGIVAPGIDLSIESANNSKLDVSVFSSGTMWPCVGIATYTWGDEYEYTDELTGLHISGNVDLNVYVNTAQNGNGIATYDSITVGGDASLEVDVRTVSKDISKELSDFGIKYNYVNSAVFCAGGGLKIDTNKIVDIRMYDAGTDEKTYAAYLNGKLDLSGRKSPLVSLALQLAHEPFAKNLNVAAMPGQLTDGYNDLYYNDQETVATKVFEKEGTVFTQGVPIVGGYFPDLGFRCFVEEKVDNNSDGFVSSSETPSEIDIDLSREADESYDAYTVRGIEYLTDLESFSWCGGKLSSLDITGNSCIMYVYVGDNRLKTIEINNLKELIEFECNGNQLKTLNIFDCPNLESLTCYGNEIKTLNIIPSSSMVYLDCEDNQLSSIDSLLRECPDLRTLLCDGNGLTSLEVSRNHQLEQLFCSDNKISSLDVSSCGKLTDLYCTDNEMEELTLGTQNALFELKCNYNKIKDLVIADSVHILDAYKNGTKSSGSYVSYTKAPYRLHVDESVNIVTQNGSAPVITSDPKPMTTVTAGQTASFSVTASGSGLSYQWEYSDDDGTTWKNWSGKTSATASAAMPLANNGYLYRCVVSNSFGSVTSTASRLFVGSAPAITSQPKAVTIKEGQTASFSVTASGTGLSYQWQYSKDNGSTWNNWSGKTAATASAAMPLANNGYLYRCIVKNDFGSVTSSSAKLTVNKEGGGHMPGDVNGDGKVNTRDVIVLLKHITDESVYTVPGSTDINGDTKVNTRDVIVLLKYITGEPVEIH